MATFTQKHYEKLAAFYKYELSIAVAEQNEVQAEHPNVTAIVSERVGTIRGLIRLLANVLQNDNPKFNIQRFYKACGLGE